MGERDRQRILQKSLKIRDDPFFVAKSSVRAYQQEMELSRLESLLDPAALDVVRRLVSCAKDCSLSALDLIKKDKFFDGQILTRTVLEATVLLVFLCQDREKFSDSVRDYLTTVFEAQVAHEASSVVETMEGYLGTEAHQVMQLGAQPKVQLDRWRRAQENYPRKLRKPLMQAYSTGDILSNGRISFECRPLLNMYKYLSHLCHADPNGLSIRYYTLPQNGTADASLNELRYQILAYAGVVALANYRLSAMDHIFSNESVMKSVPKNKYDFRMTYIAGAVGIMYEIRNNPELRGITAEDIRKRLSVLKDKIQGEGV